MSTVSVSDAYHVQFSIDKAKKKQHFIYRILLLQGNDLLFENVYKKLYYVSRSALGFAYHQICFCNQIKKGWFKISIHFYAQRRKQWQK